MERQYRNAFQRPITRGAKYGAIAGFIATWSISTAIAASELELGLPISTFYSIMGISLGSGDFVSGAYAGFALHIVTGTLLGAAFGAIALKVGRRNKMTDILDPYRSIVMGILTGVLVWLVLFLPVTALFVQPSAGRIGETLQQADSGLPALIGNSFLGIAISAIAFHIVWGAIFGFIVSSLARIRASPLFASSLQGQRTQFTKIALFGLAAGLISSLAISGLVLLAERINSLPIGTFYHVRASALTGSYSGNSTAVALGLTLHLLAGSFMGLIMSVPFMLVRDRRAFVQKYSLLYGLAFGFGLWLVLFMPVSYMLVIPFLNSFESQDVVVGQRVPTGEVSSATFFGLMSMMDRVIYSAMAFNIFYGVLSAILIQSFYARHLASKRQEQKSSIVGG